MLSGGTELGPCVLAGRGGSRVLQGSASGEVGG